MRRLLFHLLPQVISFAMFTPGDIQPMQGPRQPQRQEETSSDRIDALAGGAGCGPLWTRILWPWGADAVSRYLYRTVVAHLPRLGLRLGLGPCPPHPDDLWVASRGADRQARCTLLCLPGGAPRPQTLAPLGRGHPPGGTVCPRERGHAGPLRRYPQEKSRAPSRRTRPCSPWRSLSPASLSPAAGLALRGGPHVPSPPTLARPPPPRPS